MNVLALAVVLAGLVLASAGLLAGLFFANRLPVTIRRIAVVGLLPFELFCAYGFFAAGEPGPGHHWWRLGYAIGFVLFAAVQVRLVLAKSA